MPSYVSNGLIYHDNKMYRKGDAINLTEAQADKLGQHVLKKEDPKPEAKETRPPAKKKLSKPKKNKEAVKADEPTSD